MNHQLISSEGNGGNYNPPAESWRLHRSLSVLLSFDLDIIDRHLGIGPTSIQRISQSRLQEGRCNNHLHLKRGTSLARVGQAACRPMENACNHGVRVCATAFRSASGPLPHAAHLFGLASKASVCSGGGQACNCRKRAAVHYSCLCRCALCACIYRLALFHPQDHRCQPPYVSAPQLTNTSDTIQIQTQLLGIYNPYFSIRTF